METCLQLKRSQPQVGSNPEPLDQKASAQPIELLQLLSCLFIHICSRSSVCGAIV